MLEKLECWEAYLEERIICYLYYIGLDGLRFAAKTRDEAFYRAVLDRLFKYERLGTHLCSQPLN
jgi:hypothetical protein